MTISTPTRATSETTRVGDPPPVGSLMLGIPDPKFDIV
jgi:hypothetical protein